MQQDYNSLWVKWLALLGVDANTRREMLGELHLEVIKGFEVAARVAAEEIEGAFNKSEVYLAVKEAIVDYLAYSVWAGYTLYLVSTHTNPQEQNLIARVSTNNLGSIWLENYSKDQNNSLLKVIDPIISMILEKETQTKMNKLFSEFPQLMNIDYKYVSNIEIFLNWVAHQGFIFGILENKLWQSEKQVNMEVIDG